MNFVVKNQDGFYDLWRDQAPLFCPFQNSHVFIHKKKFTGEQEPQIVKQTCSSSCPFFDYKINKEKGTVEKVVGSLAGKSKNESDVSLVHLRCGSNMHGHTIDIEATIKSQKDLEDLFKEGSLKIIK